MGVGVELRILTSENVRPTLRYHTKVIVATAMCFACSPADRDQNVRGHGLRAAELPPAAEARIDEAALGGAFDLNDPALTLLLDSRVLPRTGGMSGMRRLPAALQTALLQGGVLHGTCQPPITGSRITPVCKARGPGYVVRFSDVLHVGGDTGEVYVAAQKYDIPATRGTESLRLERAYQIVGTGTQWRAIREARVPEGGA
jgi:hypothetical protein